MLIPIILAGGSGNRLWPSSRNSYPKQFLCLLHQTYSLFQQTILRLDSIGSIADPIIVCHEQYRFIVAEQLRSIGKNTSGIILEPESKNTAPAITAAILFEKILLKSSINAVFLVLPADHEIQNLLEFKKAISSGISLSMQNKLITFGVQPSRPETGYGYIKRGKAISDGFLVSSFIEKPSLSKAKNFLDSNEYYWNCGIFLFNGNTLLAEINKYCISIFTSCKQSLINSHRDLDFIRLNTADYNNCLNMPIDIAVMEQTENAVVIPLESKWNDIGAWNSIWKTQLKDRFNNYIKGDVFIEKTTNSLIHAESRLVTTIGIDDIIVIETTDAVLVAKKNNSQDVKMLVERLKTEGREEALQHKRVYRPWGWYESICSSTDFQVKRIIVSPKGSLSLQMHNYRAEHWIVVKGTAKVTNGNTISIISTGQSTYIPIGEKHRLENPGTSPLELIEIQTGTYLGEDDIVRFEDIYNR